jgi:hypothetical protein
LQVLALQGPHVSVQELGVVARGVHDPYSSPSAFAMACGADCSGWPSVPNFGGFTFRGRTKSGRGVVIQRGRGGWPFCKEHRGGRRRRGLGDGGKRVEGRKRHLLVDTEGFALSRRRSTAPRLRIWPCPSRRLSRPGRSSRAKPQGAPRTPTPQGNNILHVMLSMRLPFRLVSREVTGGRSENSGMEYRPLTQEKVFDTDLRRKFRSVSSAGGHARRGRWRAERPQRDGCDWRVPTKPHNTDRWRKSGRDREIRSATIPTSHARFRGQKPRSGALLSGGRPQYRPLTQGIPTPYARNTDRAGKEYRPLAQGDTDPWRKGIPTSRAKTAEDTDLSRKEYRPLAQVLFRKHLQTPGI